jgi:hypothetical protein
MATVSERSRELAIALETHSCAEPVGKCEHWNGVIEQALLAERRLAMEFCAEIVRDYAFPVGARHSGTFNKALHEISEQLRAAAEKEAETNLRRSHPASVDRSAEPGSGNRPPPPRRHKAGDPQRRGMRMATVDIQFLIYIVVICAVGLVTLWLDKRGA